MDGGGRLPESLSETTAPQSTGRASSKMALRRRRSAGRAGGVARLIDRLGWWRHLGRRLGRMIDRTRLPGHIGIAGALLIVVASAGYGAIRGGHIGEIVSFIKDMRDMAANAAGFNIATVALVGQRDVSREEILATAGVTGRASLLFLDVVDARTRLLTNPWIGEATVQKLLPDRLVISVVEREPFALWQKAGRVSVIASDGTVLEPYVVRRYSGLPLVVGTAADTHAKEFLAMLDHRPELRLNVRAAVLVAERRWNLRLKNGVDVRLPEFDIERALDQLAALEHDYKLSGRDLASIDLRLPDRVTVRLSDAAAQSRDDAIKKKQQKSKGGNA